MMSMNSAGSPERPAMRRLLGAWIAIAAVVAASDQFTKAVISGVLYAGEVREITGFFNLVLAFNRGAAFSILANASGWQREFFIGIAVLASVLILWLLWRHVAERVFCFGLALILGGAIGNLWDRIVHGHVVDFIQLHVARLFWPAFNVADSAITVGAALLIWDSFRSRAAPPARNES
ncbi:MAG: signal peptidase II [Betaproteobacteria bacterium]|nr:signal peptidase II [Betaproteobacteria bacterium]